MIIKKVKYSLVFILILMGFLAIILFWSASFLDYNAPVKSGNTVVEGWLQACELEQIADRLQNVNTLIVVGNTYSDNNKFVQDYFNEKRPDNSGKGRWLYANSTLIFDPELLNLKTTDDSLHIIVRAKGTEAAGQSAHFNLIVNGKFSGDNFSTGKMKDYSFDLVNDDDGLKAVAVRFDNDCGFDGEDRNLFVYSIIIDGEQIVAGKSNSLITNSENRFTTGFASKAEVTLNYLKAIGMEPKSSHTVSFTPARENQTYAAAMEFRKWIVKTDIQSFNIVSAGVHSRRTWITYKSVLGDSFEIGIVSLETEKYGKNSWWQSVRGIGMMIDELFSYIGCTVQCSFNK